MSRSKGKLKKIFKTKGNESTTIQNLRDATKAVLRGKFTTIQVFFSKEEKSQVDILTHHLNELEKEQQIKPKVSRRKEIINIRKEINKLVIKKTIKKSIKPRVGSLQR